MFLRGDAPRGDDGSLAVDTGLIMIEYVFPDTPIGLTYRHRGSLLFHCRMVTSQRSRSMRITFSRKRYNGYLGFVDQGVEAWRGRVVFDG